MENKLFPVSDSFATLPRHLALSGMVDTGSNLIFIAGIKAQQSLEEDNGVGAVLVLPG